MKVSASPSLPDPERFFWEEKSSVPNYPSWNRFLARQFLGPYIREQRARHYYFRGLGLLSLGLKDWISYTFPSK